MKNGNICNYSDSSCGEEHSMDDDTWSLSISLEKILSINYTYGYLKQALEKISCEG